MVDQKSSPEKTQRFNISESVKNDTNTSSARSLGGEPGNAANEVESLQVHNAVGEENTRIAEKRAKNLFKKLRHLHMTRMLTIIGYIPTEGDERKFLHANYK